MTPNEEAVARSVNREAQAGYQRERDAKRLVEQAARAMARCYEPNGDPTGWRSYVIPADAVLVVVAPLLRAEGAATERERIKQGIEALPAKRWGFATEPGERGWVRVEDVLALVSREAEASE